MIEKLAALILDRRASVCFRFCRTLVEHVLLLVNVDDLSIVVSTTRPAMLRAKTLAHLRLDVILDLVCHTNLSPVGSMRVNRDIHWILLLSGMDSLCFLLVSGLRRRTHLL